MALIAIASDKGAPGVTTAALALAAVWPRPVLLAECDQAGGDLVYRFPAVGGGHLDPRRGVLSLAVVARRGMQPQQVWEHVQKLHGGLDVLAGVTNAEQGAGLSLLWGPIGKALAALPQADVIADCGRLGADGPLYDLLVEATTVVLVSKVHVADVIRLRDRAAAFAAAAQSRGRRGFGVGVVVVAEHKKFRAALGEVQHVLGQANAPATVLGGIAHDTKGADLLSGEWGGNLDRTMLIKTAREVAQQLVQGLPPIGDPAARPRLPPAPSPAPPRLPDRRPRRPALRHARPPAGAACGAAVGADCRRSPAAAAASRARARVGSHAGTAARAGIHRTSAAASQRPHRSRGRTAARAARAAAQPVLRPGRDRLSGPAADHPAPRRRLARPARLRRPTVSAATRSPAPTVSAGRAGDTRPCQPVLGGRGGRIRPDPAPSGGGPDQPEVPGRPQPARHRTLRARPRRQPRQAVGIQAAARQAAGTPGPGTQVRASPARRPGGRPAGGGPAFSRPPMPPLTPSAGLADPGELQRTPRTPAGARAPWQPPGPAGPSPPGGG